MLQLKRREKSQQCDREGYSSAFKTVNGHTQLTGRDEVVFLIKQLKQQPKNNKRKR